MILEKIAKSIETNKHILEKKEISPVVQYIEKNTYKSPHVFSDIGEDSAAIKNNDKYILITTDRIKTEFIENFPFGAGFSSILVSVDDIYACGGTPLAASVIISVKDETIGNAILEGISEGSKKFKVPIVRGHTNIQGKFYELSSTMIGEIQREDYISAGNAQIGDDIILAVDFDGKPGKASKLYYDTTTFKSSEEVLRKRNSLNIIAKKHLANASKDVSNGGIFGTLLQMIKYSDVGADVNINTIKIPPILLEKGYTLKSYIESYLTTSFLLTCSGKNSEEMIDTFQKYGLVANVIGKIINDPCLLRINNGKKSIDVMKF
ncbi:MAG: AIR synthase related protein [Promethearchaeota archaeon]|jgi:selenophosphate synthetase-related protein